MDVKYIRIDCDLSVFHSFNLSYIKIHAQNSSILYKYNIGLLER